MRIITLLLPIAMNTGCTKTDNFKDLQVIPQYIEKQYPNTKEWENRIRKQSEDPDLPTYPNLKLNKAQLEEIKENPFVDNRCLTCPEYLGDDPNMKVR